MRILLVDDSGLSQSMLRAIFTRLIPGCAVQCASSGEAALEIIDSEKEPFDIITIDLYMPGIGGFEVAEELKKRGVNAKMALITATENQALIERTRNMGLRYMLKPVNPHRVRKTFMLR